jgi:hypothetical protein
MLSHAKVSKFDFTIRAHKNVCTFDISAKKKKYEVIIANLLTEHTDLHTEYYLWTVFLPCK